MNFAQLLRSVLHRPVDADAVPPGQHVARARPSLLPRVAPGFSFAVLAGLGKRKAKKGAGTPTAPTPLPTPEHTPQRPMAPRGGPIDPDPDDEMCGTGLVALARRRERARCAAIVTSLAGLRNPVMARTLALQTRMPRAEALRLLELQPAPFDRSAARQARNPRVGAGMPEGRTSSAAVAQSWDRAFNAAAPRRTS